MIAVRDFDSGSASDEVLQAVQAVTARIVQAGSAAADVAGRILQDSNRERRERAASDSARVLRVYGVGESDIEQ